MNMLQRYIKTAIDISTLAEYIDKTAAVITVDGRYYLLHMCPYCMSCNSVTLISAFIIIIRGGLIND